MLILCQFAKGRWEDCLRMLDIILDYTLSDYFSSSLFPDFELHFTYLPAMFDSFIKPRAEPHLTDPSDAGADDWVMRNPGTFPLLLPHHKLTNSVILQYLRNDHVCHHRILRLLPLARPDETFRTMYQETSKTNKTPSRD